MVAAEQGRPRHGPDHRAHFGWSGPQVWNAGEGSTGASGMERLELIMRSRCRESVGVGTRFDQPCIGRPCSPGERRGSHACAEVSARLRVSPASPGMFHVEREHRPAQKSSAVHEEVPPVVGRIDGARKPNVSRETSPVSRSGAAAVQPDVPRVISAPKGSRVVPQTGGCRGTQTRWRHSRASATSSRAEVRWSRTLRGLGQGYHSRPTCIVIHPRSEVESCGGSLAAHLTPGVCGQGDPGRHLASRLSRIPR